MTANQPHLSQDDLLWRQLKTIPAFRALLRAVESRFYRQIELPGPMLDLGCGDGHFAQMTFDKPQEERPFTVGIDPWWGPLQKAQHSGQYAQVMQGMGNRLPFPDNCFGSAISNSVLEHIPDVQPVLDEVGRVLKPGGYLVITMPSHYFTQNLGGAAFFEKLGLPGLAGRYRQLFNFISRHAHTDAAEVWADRLARAGFTVERWQYYFSTRALRALEWGHVQGLPSAVLHAVTGHWILAPWESSLRRTERWLRPFYNEEAPPNGAYVLFIARKANTGMPVEVQLPASRPFTMAELAHEPEPAQERLQEPENEPALEGRVESDEPEAPKLQEGKKQAESEVVANVGPKLISGGMTLLAVLFAMMGLARLRSGQAVGSSGLWQFALSGVFVLLLWAYRRGRNSQISPRFIGLPEFSAIPPRVLLVAPALLLSLLSYNSSNAERPWLALFLWFTAVGLAYFALWHASPPPSQTTSYQQYSSLIALGLFMAALLLRTINLEGLPFILNGTEAVQGLDALRAARGEWLSPFSSNWQGAPALPFFMLALPLKLFGPSVVSLRLLSPLVGALTVVATFWLGQRLWGRAVGLTAAILLLGGHWHLHYSRLGLVVIWEPLLALLALGLAALAWQERMNRRTWLAAGTAVGCSVYFVSDPRLIPSILVGFGLLLLLVNRAAFLPRGRFLLAGVIIALVVALPQLLHNQAQPVSTWELANQSSILSPGNEWLPQEAASSGLSESAVLRQQVWRGMLAFIGSADNSPSFRTQNSLLGFGPGLLAILGVITAVFYLREGRTLLLLSWIGTTIILAAVLLPNSPQSDRLLVAAPALALLGGFGLVTLAQWQGQNETPFSKPVLLAIIGLAVVFGARDSWYYFGRYPAENGFADRNTEAAHRMANYLNGFDETWSAFFFGPPAMYVDFPTITFLAQGFIKGDNLFSIEPAPENQLPPTTTPNIVFIFLPERWQEATTVQNTYQSGQIRSFAGVYANPLFYSYEVPLADSMP